MQLEIVNESGFPLEYSTAGSIGLDLRACMSSPERIIEPGRRFRFDTGIRIALPDGYGAFVQPRSGMGLAAQCDYVRSVKRHALLSWYAAHVRGSG